ncbi:MAG: hypothetical protein WAZ34_11490 [Rhodocyclaceae bacterium]
MPVSPITPAAVLSLLQGYLQTALHQNVIRLESTGRGNQRADSRENEVRIGNSLRAFALGHPMFTRDGMIFEVTINGAWYDFLVRNADNTIFIPINLKVSSLRGRDNLSSKEGLYFALTGIRPQGGVIRNWDLFCQNIAANLRRDNCDADYYYLVVQKPPTGETVGQVFWTSLLQLQMVYPNGSNPPFQCKWQENTERANRTRSEAVDKLLDVVGETFVLRARALESFKQHAVPGFSGALHDKWIGATPEVEGEAA